MTFIFICALAMSGIAQKEDDYRSESKSNKTQDSNFKDRLVYGGNLGLWFGSNSSYVQINPMVGYKLTNWLASGVGYNYTWFGNRLTNVSYHGPSVWARARPLQGFYLHTEYALLRANYYNQTIPVWLVGGGIVTSSDAFSIGFFAMYDLIQHEFSPYRGGIVPTGGFLIGF